MRNAGKALVRGSRIDRYDFSRIWARCHEIVYLHAYLREESGPLLDEMRNSLVDGVAIIESERLRTELASRRFPSCHLLCAVLPGWRPLPNRFPVFAWGGPYCFPSARPQAPRVTQNASFLSFSPSSSEHPPPLLILAQVLGALGFLFLFFLFPPLRFWHMSATASASSPTSSNAGPSRPNLDSNEQNRYARSGARSCGSR